MRRAWYDRSFQLSRVNGMEGYRVVVQVADRAGEDGVTTQRNG